MSAQRGLTLVELLVAVTTLLLIMLAVLGAYSQARDLKTHVEGSIRVQNNVRVALDRVERDLRMIGFGVPTGQQIGSTTLWTPRIFYASPTAIGYRADIDGSRAEVVCTPKSTNVNCPLTKLRLDSIAYYQALNCDRPDGASGDLRLVAVFDRNEWSPITCSTYTSADSSITVSSVTNNKFIAGRSEAVTLEQVYYRYFPATSPPYGTITRQIRYDNTPSSTFPPTGLASSTVARQLIDFWIEYYDGSGAQLTGSPLSSTQLPNVRSIVVFMEGYDRAGPDGHPQRIQMRSEILLRNAG